MTEPLTPTERRVYHYLLDFLAENTYQPSIREIGKRFRIKSTKSVSDVLQALVEKGYIERDPSRSRGVRILGYATAAQTRPVPIYGKIAPGEPSLLPEHRTGFITLDRRFLPNDEVFMLRLADDAMIGRGMCVGDFVLVNPSNRASDGEIVAARVGADFVVRTLTHRGATIVLEPANAGDHEIVVGPADSFAVLGVVSAVFRAMYDAETRGEREGSEETEAA